MTIERVALYAPGDMGHAIGRVMVENGIDVVTNLADRSLRTMELADKAGIRDVADDLAAIDGSDVVLSILHPPHTRCPWRNAWHLPSGLPSDGLSMWI